MATKDYKTNHEIQIAVKSGNRAAVEGKGRRKSTAEPSKKQRPFLHRRQKPAGIRIFDLGQKRIGDAWVSINVQIAPPLITSPTAPPTIRPPQLSDYQAIAADFLGETGDYTKKFRQITDGTTLESNSFLYASGSAFSDFLVNLPPSVWKDSSLIVTDADLAAGVAFGTTIPFVENVTLKDDGTYKITALPSFAAPSVPFTPTKRMDVFLVPTLTVPYVSAGQVAGSGFTYVDVAGLFMTTIFRPSLFDPLDPNYQAFNSGANSDSWPAFYYILNYIKSQGGVARAGNLDFSPDIWSVVPVSSVPFIGLFPAPPIVPPTSSGGVPRYDNVAGYLPYQAAFQFFNAASYSGPGGLAGIVQQNNNKFYFWITT